MIISEIYASNECSIYIVSQICNMHVPRVTSDTSDIYNQTISINFPFIAVFFGAFHIFPLLVEEEKTTKTIPKQQHCEKQLLN